MNRTRFAWLSGVVAVFAVLVFSSSLFVTSGQSARTAKDVVMLRCNTADAEFSTSGYQGSSGTLSKRSKNCSENVAQLLKEGFVIQDIGHYDMEKAGYAVFTMVR